jgi:8-oxo-dGDP phosphatase
VATRSAAPGAASGRHEYAVLSRQEQFHGPVFSVVSDEVTMPDGGTAVRDYIRHVGAVAVVALDRRGRVALILQYRHPVGKPLWELPAGLLDVPGEDPAAAAARELAEEVDLRARDWRPLLDLHTSPGYSDESIRVYLAEGLSQVPQDERRQRRHEEYELVVHWRPLHRAVAMVLQREITNATCVAGVLAAAQAHRSVRAGTR